MGGERGEDDDDALWAKIVEGAAPLKKKHVAARKIVAKQPAPSPAAKSKPKPPPAPPPPKLEPKPAPAPLKAPLDRKTARELDKGRLEVEARLDLHGMRQRDAHAELKRFLRAAQARGLKHVLIITGKGASLDRSGSFYEEEQRGVLRNAVPHWLAEPDFAKLVVSVSAAPRRLGGEGALYVRVRRARPA